MIKTASSDGRAFYLDKLGRVRQGPAPHGRAAGPHVAAKPRIVRKRSYQPVVSEEDPTSRMLNEQAFESDRLALEGWLAGKTSTLPLTVARFVVRQSGVHGSRPNVGGWSHYVSVLMLSLGWALSRQPNKTGGMGGLYRWMAPGASILPVGKLMNRGAKQVWSRDYLPKSRNNWDLMLRGIARPLPEWAVERDRLHWEHVARLLHKGKPQSLPRLQTLARRWGWSEEAVLARVTSWGWGSP